MTELDKKLQQIACKNWEQFAEIVGPQAMNDAKICLLRQARASYGQISKRLDIPRQTVISNLRRNCKCLEEDVLQNVNS